MQLGIGEKIDLGIGKAEVLGMLKFHTYTEYLLRMDLLGRGPENFGLEQGREWRLWRKIEPPFKPVTLSQILKEKWDKRDLLGESLASLNWLIIQEVGFAQVLKAAGETEETEISEKVIYVEGYFPERSGWEFNLFAAEIWDNEVECYEGRIVEVRRV